MSTTDEQRLREMLQERFAYAPLTGVFTSRKTGKMVGVRPNDRGYATISFNGKTCRAHRVAWFYMSGEWPTGDIDHIDGDKLNNRWSNLRDVDHLTNTQNRRVVHSKTGYLGVQPHRGGFRATIKAFGKTINLGTQSTAELASATYVEAKRQLHPDWPAWSTSSESEK